MIILPFYPPILVHVHVFIFILINTTCINFKHNLHMDIHSLCANVESVENLKQCYKSTDLEDLCWLTYYKSIVAGVVGVEYWLYSLKRKGESGKRFSDMYGQMFSDKDTNAIQYKKVSILKAWYRNNWIWNDL